MAVKRPSSNSWRTVWCYSHANFESACDLLDATDWFSMFSNDATDVNVLWSLWHKRFLEVMDICIPKKRLPPKKHLPWLSPTLLSAIKRRNILSSGHTNALAQSINLKNTRNKEILSLQLFAMLKDLSSISFIRPTPKHFGESLSLCLNNHPVFQLSLLEIFMPLMITTKLTV